MIKFLTFDILLRNYDIRAKTSYHIFPPKWRWFARAQYLVLGESRTSIVVVSVMQSKAHSYLLFPRFRNLCIQLFLSFISDGDDSENHNLVYQIDENELYNVNTEVTKKKKTALVF